jgi:hypothetical protein
VSAPQAEHKFRVGQVVGTPGAIAALGAAGESASKYLDRHVVGDWGDLDADDKRANDEAIGDEGRIFSAYILPTKVKIWVITEADRASTCILLPEEY